MHQKKNIKSRMMLFITIVVMVAAGAVLGACDTPSNNSGCGNDNGNNNNNTGTEDPRPLIPDASWDCKMPGGIPSPEKGELVFEANMTLGNIRDLGQTQFGRRHLIEVKGGTVSGPDISAKVLDGGLDFQLTLSNGAMEIDQVNVLQTSDGSYIYFRNCGASADQTDVRIVPDFEAPSSSAYSFLNTGKFAGTRELDVARKTMKLKVYDVSNVKVNAAAAGAVKVIQPKEVPDQSWECREASSSERQGAELYTEKVNIGSSLAVGNSKNGRRNIIPITGGTATGDIAGKVLFGGGDYQIISSSAMMLDARYTIQTNDGELIIVRNCGKAAALVPTFETRANGKYGYLNDQLWLSSSPGIGAGSVTLTIYESR